MKYSLRTLIIAATFGPPILAGSWFFLGYSRDFLSLLTPWGWAVVGFIGLLVMVPLALCSWALVKLGHRDDGDRSYLFLRQVFLDLTLFALFVVVGIPAMVTAILTIL